MCRICRISMMCGTHQDHLPPDVHMKWGTEGLARTDWANPLPSPWAHPACLLELQHAAVNCKCTPVCLLTVAVCSISNTTSIIRSTSVCTRASGWPSGGASRNGPRLFTSIGAATSPSQYECEFVHGVASHAHCADVSHA